MKRARRLQSSDLCHTRLWRGAWTIFHLTLGACASPLDPPSVDGTVSELRDLTHQEAQQDFDQIVTSMQGLYDALDRKQQRYGFAFEDLVVEYRDKLSHASTDAEYRALFSEFLARFHDGHVYFASKYDDNPRFVLPVLVQPIEKTFFIAAVNDIGDNDGIQLNDEVLSVDGTPIADAVAPFTRFIGVPNERTRLAFAAAQLTRRPFYLAEGLQSGLPVTLLVRNAAGEERDATVRWVDLQDPLPDANSEPAPSAKTGLTAKSYSGSLARLTNARSSGAPQIPNYMTKPVLADLSIQTVVKPSAAALERYGVTPQAAAVISYFAVKYAFGGKNMLLLRISTYDVPSALRQSHVSYLAALLDEQAPFVDGLVLDQTGNPGGILCGDVVTLLASHNYRGEVDLYHADRQSIDRFQEAARTLHDSSDAAERASAENYERYASEIESAYDKHESLSAPIPETTAIVEPDPRHWTKPFIVLADELSASCAETLPLLVKANHLAPIFGARTAGAGAMVDFVATLTNSGLGLMLPRGLFTVYDPSGDYPEEDFVEDQGVTPNIAYSQTLEDARAGYTGYVRAFNSALLETIQHVGIKD
jgi:hypothetical protein